MCDTLIVVMFVLVVCVAATSLYSTDVYAVLDVRIAACLLLVSAAVVFYAIVSVHRGAYTSYCLSRCYLY